jgi:hypothetical protein
LQRELLSHPDPFSLLICRLLYTVPGIGLKELIAWSG